MGYNSITCTVVTINNILYIVKHEPGGRISQEFQAPVFELNGRIAIQAKSLKLLNSENVHCYMTLIEQFILITSCQKAVSYMIWTSKVSVHSYHIERLVHQTLSNNPALLRKIVWLKENNCENVIINITKIKYIVK